MVEREWLLPKYAKRIQTKTLQTTKLGETNSQQLVEQQYSIVEPPFPSKWHPCLVDEDAKQKGWPL